MRIFHLATASGWAAAEASGAYTTSTRGVSLADEGFIHAAREDQWQRVRERYYADADEPLVLLAIETDLLEVPGVVEEVPGGETFLHVYGAIRPATVVKVTPLTDLPREAPPSGSPLPECWGPLGACFPYRGAFRLDRRAT